MAKTRSQSRNKSTANLKFDFKKNFVMKDCRVRLDRIDLTKINSTRKIDLKPTAHLKFNFKQNFVMKDCRVRLDRINLTEINSICNINSGEKSHNLRKRATIENLVTKKVKPLNQIVAQSQAALFTSRAVRMWDALKKQCTKNKIKIHENDVVCARMSGHRPWPSRVIEFKRNGVLLHFYGTNESGTVKKSEIVPLVLCQEMIAEYLYVPTRHLCSKTLSYHMSFIKSTREVSCINV